MEFYSCGFPLGHTRSARGKIHTNFSFKLLANATCSSLDLPGLHLIFFSCCFSIYAAIWLFTIFHARVYRLLAPTTSVARWPVWADLNQNLNCVNCAYFDWICRLALSFSLSAWQCGLPTLFVVQKMAQRVRLVAWKHDNCWLITGKQNLKLIKFALMAESSVKA